MVRKSHGLRANTRKKFSKRFSESKFTITPYLAEFKPSDKVVIKVDPTSHKGMPYHRFHGLIGEIKEKRGRSYVVKIEYEHISKDVIARPEHLRLHK